jgi:hypothetical protein
MAVCESCPYCGLPGWDLLTVELSEDEAIRVDITGNLLRAFSDSLDSYHLETMQIKFCPVCGAKLPREFP